MPALRKITLAVLLAFPFAPQAQDPKSLSYAQKQVKMWDTPSYASPDGKTTLKSLMDLSQTKPVLLFIWAPWCPYCKEIMPAMEAMYKKGVALAGIPLDDTKANVTASIAQHRMTFPQLYAGGGDVISREDTSMRGFDFPAVPTQLIIFKGEVKLYVPGSYGSQTEAILSEELDKYK